MELTPGNIIFVTQVTSGLVEQADINGEEATIIELCDGDSTLVATHTLCWIEWADRPVRYQRNGAVLPRTQVWVPNNIKQYIKAA
mgnify:CR=1 FL=1|jgi:hypothetical protein|tara:strand:+ start:315 stop:569 length:255 start_codon:yes stop_codon:yes gene_type:complete